MTIVVAHADTAPGAAALTAALAEATAAAEDVVLVPAVRGAEVPDVAALRAAFAAETAAHESRGGRLRALRGELNDPSDNVVQVAQQLDARLIVLGLRHRTPVGKVVFGSTAQRILLDATCPVLAVKPEPGA